MAQMADPARPVYGHQDYHGYPQHSPPQRQDGSRDDNRSAYPPPDAARQGQYHTPYPPPQQWAGQPPPAPQPYPYPPPPQHPHDPHHQYHYPHPHPPPTQPGQAIQPDPYRLPPPYPPHGYYAPPAYQTPPAPAPRQRTAIACKYCRKRKIRCSGYDSSSDGRCQNCVRFNQQCLFHPVSSQAAFVPASALYGPNAARAPMAGPDGSPGQNGQPPMLYGAHGQPLGPAGPGGVPQYNYPPPGQHAPPQGYPPVPYSGYPPPGYANGPSTPSTAPTSQYEHPPQSYHAPASDRSDRGSLKRGPPDDDTHNEANGTALSPHPNTKPRHGYDGRTSGSFEFNGPTSPATSTMSYQSYPPHNYNNNSSSSNHNAQPAKGNNSPPAGLTPNSIHSTHSPRAGATDSRTPPPGHPGSAGSSQNGRSGMKVHEMLGNPGHVGPREPHDQRGKNDNDMLSKLDRKK